MLSQLYVCMQLCNYANYFYYKQSLKCRTGEEREIKQKQMVMSNERTRVGTLVGTVGRSVKECNAGNPTLERMTSPLAGSLKGMREGEGEEMSWW